MDGDERTMYAERTMNYTRSAAARDASARTSTCLPIPSNPVRSPPPARHGTSTTTETQATSQHPTERKKRGEPPARPGPPGGGASPCPGDGKPAAAVGPPPRGAFASLGSVK